MNQIVEANRKIPEYEQKSNYLGQENDKLRQ